MTNDTQTIDADALRARLAEMAQQARDEMGPAGLRECIEAALRARNSNDVVRVEVRRYDVAQWRASAYVGEPIGEDLHARPQATEAEALATLARAVGLNPDGADPRDQGEALARRLHTEREAVVAELDRVRDETDYLDALLARQHAILTGVANALRGDPGPLASHSHHDLAERAAAAVAEVARLRALLEVAQTSLAAATSGRRVTACDEIERLQRERDALRDAAREMLAAIEAPAPVWDADESEHDAHAARLTAAIAALRPLVGDGALDATRAAEDHATADDPLLDGTDGAHPAWWRGHDRAAEMLTAQRDAAVARAEAAGGERDALRDAAREYLDARHSGLVALDAYLDADPADAAARDAASACEARVTAARTRLAALVGDGATMRRDLTADLIDGAYVLRPHSRRETARVGLGGIVWCDGGTVRAR